MMTQGTSTFILNILKTSLKRLMAICIVSSASWGFWPGEGPRREGAFPVIVKSSRNVVWSSTARNSWKYSELLGLFNWRLWSSTRIFSSPNWRWSKSEKWNLQTHNERRIRNVYGKIIFLCAIVPWCIFWINRSRNKTQAFIIYSLFMYFIFVYVKEKIKSS